MCIMMLFLHCTSARRDRNPLSFPLLFPNGEPGFQQNLELIRPEGQTQQSRRRTRSAGHDDEELSAGEEEDGDMHGQ